MLLQLKGIEKRFGGVTALRNGCLDVRAGEVHLLMGENGAGKSTLMKIVAGMQQADGGDFLWKSKRASFQRPADASAVGIAMVHQESLLAPHLTVAENIFLGREEGFWVQRQSTIAKATRLIEQHGFPLKADWRVGRLSPAGKQLVEICRAVSQGSSLLIFDEPTSSLSEAETVEVFRIVRQLKERGMGVVYITHRMEELRSIGDSITVLRDGTTVHTGPLADLSQDELIRQMVGREVSAQYQRAPVAPGPEMLRMNKVCAGKLVRDISLTVRAGEIVGVAGLMGAGRTELCRAIFGIDRIASGTVAISGKPVVIHSPRDAVRAGIALIPEDRQRTGLSTMLSVKQNISVASLDKISQLGIVNTSGETELARTYEERLRIKSSKQAAGRLSGGNQQKSLSQNGWLGERGSSCSTSLRAGSTSARRLRCFR